MDADDSLAGEHEADDDHQEDGNGRTGGEEHKGRGREEDQCTGDDGNHAASSDLVGKHAEADGGNAAAE
ncbi:hypothetical protein D3C85_1914120 [compost metagenome]